MAAKLDPIGWEKSASQSLKVIGGHWLDWLNWLGWLGWLGWLLNQLDLLD